jgi:hypothetical protein
MTKEKKKPGRKPKAKPAVEETKEIAQVEPGGDPVVASIVAAKYDDPETDRIAAGWPTGCDRCGYITCICDAAQETPADNAGGGDIVESLPDVWEHRPGGGGPSFAEIDESGEMFFTFGGLEDQSDRLPALGRDNAIGRLADVAFASGYFGKLTPAQLALRIYVGESLGLKPAAALFDLEIARGDRGPSVRWVPGQPAQAAADAIAWDQGEQVSDGPQSGTIASRPIKYYDRETGKEIEPGTAAAIKVRESRKRELIRMPAGNVVEFDGGDTYRPATIEHGETARITNLQPGDKPGDIVAAAEMLDAATAAIDENANNGPVLPTEPEPGPNSLETEPIDSSQESGETAAVLTSTAEYQNAQAFTLGEFESANLHNAPAKTKTNIDDRPGMENFGDLVKTAGEIAQASPEISTADLAAKLAEPPPMPDAVIAGLDGMRSDIADLAKATAGDREPDEFDRAVARARASADNEPVEREPINDSIGPASSDNADQVPELATPKTASPAAAGSATAGIDGDVAGQAKQWRKDIDRMFKELGFTADGIGRSLAKFDAADLLNKRALLDQAAKFYNDRVEANRAVIIAALERDGKVTHDQRRGWYLYAEIPDNPDLWSYKNTATALNILNISDSAAAKGA